MLDFVDDASTREKCMTSVTQLPAFIDPKQIPSKKPPFSAIIKHPFVHTVLISGYFKWGLLCGLMYVTDECQQVEAILPEDVYNNIQASLESKLEKIQCARVFMYPADLFEHEFFNTYIRKGTFYVLVDGLRNF